MSLPQMINNPLSSGSGNHQGNNTIEEQEKARKRNTLQRSIIMLESDLKKKTIQKAQVFSDLRRLKKEESEARMNQQVKQEEMRKLEDEIRMMEVEISGTRKKINLL